MADAAATFGLDVQGNIREVTDDMAEGLEGFRSKVKGSQDAVKSYQEALRGLTGKSQEVVDAKSKLRAAIDRERANITANNLAIQKHGVTYGQLAAKMKEATKSANDNGKSIKAVGGPVSEMVDKWKSFKEALTGGNKAALVAGGALALLTIAAVAAGAALIGGAIALGKWILASADAARSMQLVREAATGSAETAANLGTQVDALAKKVPTAKKELNDLAADLYRRFNNTAASGQVIVDTFNVIAQASASMGDTVGKQLGDIIERGKRFGRIQINPFELQGTGVKFQDVAGELAKQTHVGIEQAKKALFEGRVTLDAGAAALRAAVDKRFGEINARKMLSLDVIFAKLHETLENLTKGVKIEPIVNAMKDFFKLFDTSSQTGTTLKTLIELLGNGLAKAIAKGEPSAKQFFKWVINRVLDVTIWFLKLGISIKQAFSGPGFDAAKDFLKLEVEIAGYLLDAVGYVDDLNESIKKVPGLWKAALGPLGLVLDVVQKIYGTQAAGAGGPSALAATVNKGKTSTFGGGGNIEVAPAHAEGGRVVQAPPGEAFAAVAPGETILPRGAGLGGGGGGARTIQVAPTFNIHVGSKAQGEAVVNAIKSANILDALTKTLEDAMRLAGVPVQTEAMP